MGDREQGLRRRTVLASTGALAFWPLAAAERSDRQARQSDGQDGYVLEQGESCVPVTPLTGSDPVEAFYDWNLRATDYSSAGTTDLQRPDTSILFLYRGPDGSLSLVVVHDAYDPTASSSRSDGGSVTFRVEGLPDGGQWMVRDDFYDEPTRYDVWQVDGEPQQIDWTWAGSRSDGGVFGPLSEPFDVTIDPAFNEDATLFGQHYDGRIVDWQVLSGDRSAPERTSLALDQSVRLRTGTCRADAGKKDDAGKEDDDGPAEVDVDVVPGRVNPDSRGLLPVDLRSTDEVSVDDIVIRSVRTVPAGAQAVAMQRQSSRAETVRLFFRIPDLELSGDGTTTFEIEAETDAGDPVTGSDTVRLTPDRGRRDDGGKSEGDGSRRDHDDGENGDGKGRKKDGGKGKKKNDGKGRKKRRKEDKGKGRKKGRKGEGGGNRDEEVEGLGDDDEDDDDDDDDDDGDDGPGTLAEDDEDEDAGDDDAEEDEDEDDEEDEDEDDEEDEDEDDEDGDDGEEEDEEDEEDDDG